MLTLLRDLFRHQEWADIALLHAVREGAPSDETLAGLLHHIATVERFFHALLTDRDFDKQAELASPRDLPSLEASFRQAHADLDAFLDSLDEPGLDRGISVHWFPGHTLPVRDILLQVVIHSQNHRGQCLTRLRELAGKAPTLDYILWAKDRHKQGRCTLKEGGAIEPETHHRQTSEENQGAEDRGRKPPPPTGGTGVGSEQGPGAASDRTSDR